MGFYNKLTWIACSVLFASGPAQAQDAVNAPVSFLNHVMPGCDFVGDPLPLQAKMRLGTLRFLHPSGAIEMAVAPDEKTVITLDSSLIIAWDLTSGKELWRNPWTEVGGHIVGPAYCQRYIAFCQSSSHFYTTSNTNMVNLWNTQEKRRAAVILESSDLGFPSTNWKSIDVTSDGTRFMLGSEYGLALFDDKGRLHWKLANRPDEPIGQAGVNDDRLTFCGDYATGRLSPDEKMVACVRSQFPKEVTLLDAQSGAELSKIETKDRVVRLCFSATGDSIIATERDCATRRYSISNQQREWEHVIPPDPRNAESYTSAVDSSSDGKLIAVGAPIGPTNLIYLLDATTGKEHATLKGHAWKPWAVKFTKDSRSLLSTGWDAAIRRWDVSSAKQLPLPQGIRGSENIAYSRDGKLIAFADDAGNIHLIDTLTGSEIRTIATDDLSCVTMVFSPDAKTLFCGGAIQSVTTKDQPQPDQVGIRAWSVGSGELEHNWQWPRGKDSHSDIEQIAISPDGRFATAAVFRQSKAYVWNIEQNKQVAVLPHNEVYGLDVSRDSRFLATAGWDQMLRVWDLATGDLVREIAVKDALKDDPNSDLRMYGVKFSPDGNHFAGVHMDGKISIWNLNGDTVPTLDHYFQCDSRFIFGAIAYSPDGFWIACGLGDSNVRIYDIQSGDELFHVGSHPDQVYTLGFGADNRTLVSGGGGISYLWNLAPSRQAGDTEDQPQALESELEMAEAWKALRGAQGDAAYRALWSLADSPKAAEYLADRLKQIRTVLDPRALARGQDKAEAKRRLELASKASAKDCKIEFSDTVQRAITALGMSKSPNAPELLKQLVDQHANETIRSWAAQAAKDGRAIVR